ncbi:hypothetical protein GGG16DRAFT_129806 [Schizophyllum commune]
MAASSTVPSSVFRPSRATLPDAVIQATLAERRYTSSCNLRATKREGRINPRTYPPASTCAASKQAWGYGGRLNARPWCSSPNLPTFRWAGLGRGPPRSDPEICDAGLEDWTATGRGHSSPFLIFSHPSLPLPLHSYPVPSHSVSYYLLVQYCFTTSTSSFFLRASSIDTERTLGPSSLSNPRLPGNDGRIFRHRATLTDFALDHHGDHDDSRLRLFHLTTIHVDAAVPLLTSMIAQQAR